VSEIAEAMQDGSLCSCCGAFVGNPVGFSRKCRDCRKPEPPYVPVVHTKIRCPHCGKRVMEAGLSAHWRDVHPAAVRKVASA
jgi:hypothetical protein